jgi:tetratricopeptide (TPR) repeat protein
MRHAFCLAASAAALCLASPAAAQDDSSLAMPIFEAGKAYYDQGSYDKALEQFEEAYRLQPLPELLYNIGQCHERLQDYPAAIEAYSRYLEEKPDAEDTQAVEEKIRNLEQKLEGTGILLHVSEEGADIYVDGERVAVSPVEYTIRTEPGTHDLEVAKDGFQTVVMKFTVPPGLIHEAQIMLLPLPDEEEEHEEEPQSEEASPATWFYWTYGVSAAAGAAAIVTGSLALSKAGKASSTNDPLLYDTNKQKARRLAISTDVLVGVAALGFIASTAGAIAAATRKSSGESGGMQPVTVAPLASPELAGVAVQLTF